MSTSLYQKTSLTSSSLLGKALAVAALVGTGYYLYDRNKESLNLKDDPEIPSWTLFKNPTILGLIWVVVLIAIALVWHQLVTVMGLDKKQIEVVNLLMITLFVLFFVTSVSFGNGRINAAMWLTWIAAAGALVATLYLWKAEQKQAGGAMALVTGWLVYRALSFNSLKKAKAEDPSEL